jgi:hypothetical protein
MKGYAMLWTAKRAGLFGADVFNVVLTDSEGVEGVTVALDSESAALEVVRLINTNVISIDLDKKN